MTSDTTKQGMDTTKDDHAHRLEMLEPGFEEGFDEVHLSWRTWLVCFTTAFFTLFVQIFTTVGAPSVIAFIIQDLGQPEISVWVIQAPLLVQAALCPIFGRLSDDYARKPIVVIPPLIAAAGSFLGAKAQDMNTLIAGYVMIGMTLATVGVVQAIPAEVLPAKYRSIANGLGFIGGVAGGLVGGLSAGAFCRAPQGWRNLFWTQGALQVTCSIALFVSYWPKKQLERPHRSLAAIFWATDPIGCFLYIGGATSLLIGLGWSSGSYPWSNPHVAVPLALGLFGLLLFGLYEALGRSDGICNHELFQSGRNLPLSLFASAVEGWMYYSAVNTITAQMVFYLEWDTDPLRIAMRQLTFFFLSTITSIFIMWYSTKYKDIKTPLVVCFTFFLAVTCTFAATQADWSTVQYGLGVLVGIGQSGPLTLLLVAAQLAVPHAHISTATSLGFSTRAIGGALGAAVLYTIVDGHVSQHYSAAVASAAVGSGLSTDAVGALLGIMRQGHGPPTKLALFAVSSKVIPGITYKIVSDSVDAGHRVYAKAYGLAWASIIPFVVLAIIGCALFKDVKNEMTDRIDAPVEEVEKPTKVVV